jgi:hypothetical protein
VHVAESSSEHLVKAATMHARSVARVLPGVPANVETLVARATRFDKKDRWASSTEMRRELWRVRLDPGRPIGTTSAPPPRNPSSNFPTVIGKRDSDKPSIREMGMSITGEVQIADSSSRRAVFLSTVIAVLLVASALTFGIYMTVGQKTKLASKTAAAAAQPLSDAPPPAAVTLPSNESGPKAAASGIAAAAEAPTTATTSASRPAVPAAAQSAAVPVKSAGNAPAATTPPRSAAKRGPAPAATGDIYKPF